MFNQLHALFNLNGISFLKKSDLAITEKRSDLVEHFFPNGLVHEQATAMNLNLDNIELNISIYEDLVRKSLLAHPKESLCWLSIPGIGMLTAIACVAYIGDGSRFSTPAQVRNYVGLIPRIDQSGIREVVYGVNHFGCMPVRRNIVQAAWSISTYREDCELKRKWMDFVEKGKKGQKIAIKIANNMLSIGWTLLRKGELYNGCSSYDYLKRKLAYYKLTAIDSSMFNKQLLG